MTASEIRARYEQCNPAGHFFSRGAMKFFGDTMRNFGTHALGNGYYHLYRREKTAKGIKGDGWVFDSTTGSMRSMAAHVSGCAL